jgi:hypothetical protein
VIEFLQANWLTLIFLVGVAAFFILFRNRTTKIEGVDVILGQGVPTFLVFDGQGNLIGREAGMSDRDKIRTLVVGS